MAVTQEDIFKLVRENKSNNLIETISNIIDNAETDFQKFDHQLKLVRTMRLAGKFKAALTTLDKLEIEKFDQELLFRYYLELSASHYRMGNNQNAVSAVNMAKEIINHHKYSSLKQYYAELYDIIGKILINENHMEEALNNFQTALQYIEEEPSDHVLSIKGSIINGMGVVHFHQGELQKANEFFGKSLIINRQLEDDRLIGLCLNNMGYNYFILGDMDLSYRYLKEALASFERINTDYFIATALFNLFRNYLYRDKIDDARKLADYLQSIAEKSENIENERIRSVNKLCKGLMLLKSSRLRHKVEAETIFEEIIDENLESQFVIVAMINLAEILLLELQVSEDRKIINEIRTIILDLEVLANKMGSNKIKIHANILHAKLNVIAGNYNQAHEIFEETLHLSNSLGITMLEKQIKDEIDALRSEVLRMKKILDENSSLSERMEVVEIQGYLKSLQNLI